jgi:hypothetical protein
MMTLTGLLWQPLPDSLPPPWSRRLRALRTLAGTIATQAELARMSPQQRTDRLARRGAGQAIVRDAYQATVAEQDRERRPPDAFTTAWRTHLGALLAQETVLLNGCPPVGNVDAAVAWTLFELASHARREAIDKAATTASRAVGAGAMVPAFQFAVTGDGGELGAVTYSVCYLCGVGLLDKIGFPADWQYCGLGRRALRELEARHPELTWYTSGQLAGARGIYDRYRQESRSPWITSNRPCAHLP